MRRDLPPFSAIRAFEAAARHLSFKKASEELCLTQSAISHQIRILETHLGAKLFDRGIRGVELTREGLELSSGMTSILDRIEEEMSRFGKRRPSGRLMVRAAPGMVRWLVPRLHRFHDAHPDVELHLTGSLAVADFKSGDVDLNIRWNYEPAPGLVSTPLMPSPRYPVVSPDLLVDGPELMTPSDLCHFSLMHEAGCPDFEKWLDLAGARIEHPGKGMRFSQYDQLLQATIEGQGVALGNHIIVSNDIAAKRLVRLFDIELPARVLYSAVTPEAWTNRPAIAAFRNWLLDEDGMSIASRSHRM